MSSVSGINVFNEKKAILEASNKTELQRLERTLTVNKSLLEGMYTQLRGVMSEVLEDPMYYEFAEGILSDLSSAIDGMEGLIERLEEDILVLNFGVCNSEVW